MVVAEATVTGRPEEETAGILRVPRVLVQDLALLAGEEQQVQVAPQEPALPKPELLERAAQRADSTEEAAEGVTSEEAPATTLRVVEAQAMLMAWKFLPGLD